MTAKHSPFPWTRDARQVLLAADGHPVKFQRLMNEGFRDDHAAANTALVEAIPVMLEALRFYADPTSWSIDGTFDGAVNDGMQPDGGQTARAAIEKATGR